MLAALFLALLPILTVPPAQPEPSVPPAMTLEEAFRLADTANPALRAARLKQVVSVAGSGVAREWPNPEARAEFERETPRKTYGVSLPIELGGKRQRRILVSEAGVRTSEAEIAETALETRVAVRRAYFGRLLADQRLALFDEIVSLAKRARDAARQRFEAGSAPRLELLQAQLAASQAENDATVARADAASALAALNVLLGLPTGAQPSLTTPLDAGPRITAADALSRANATNAELVILQRRVEEAQARIALAHALRAPDLTPEAAITRDAQPEFDTGWRAAIAVTLPLFTTHLAAVRVEEAALAQIEAEQAAARARISAGVTTAVTVVDARREQLARYREEILPQAMEVERMAQDSYTLGQTGIAALLQALQATRDARLRMLQAATDFQESLAALERALGAPLP